MFFVAALSMLWNSAVLATATVDCDVCAEQLVNNGGCVIFEDKTLDSHLSEECNHRDDCASQLYDACKETCSQVNILGCNYESCCLDEPLALCSTDACSLVYGYCCKIQDAPEEDVNDFDLNPAVVPTADPTANNKQPSDCDSCAVEFLANGGCEVFSNSMKPMDPNSYVSAGCYNRMDCSDLIYSECEASCKKVNLIGCDYEACCGDIPNALCNTKECLDIYGYCCEIEVIVVDRNQLAVLEPAVVPTADPSGGHESNHNEYVTPCAACSKDFLNDGGCALYGINREQDVDLPNYFASGCTELHECNIPSHAVCESYCNEFYIPGCDYDTCCTDNPSALCFTTECIDVFGYCCDILSTAHVVSR